MKFYIDTSDVEEIKAALDLGIISGVTTNPSIIARSWNSFEDAVSAIDAVVNEEMEVFAEVLSTSCEDMVKEGKKIASLRKNMVVKLPMTMEAIKAIGILSQCGIKTCATICFHPVQALLASVAKANYVAPYLSRIDDIGYDGMKTVKDIHDICRRYDLRTEILCASIRSPKQMIELAKEGIEAVTLAPSFLRSLMTSPSTEQMIVKFQEDWENAVRTAVPSVGEKNEQL